MSSYVFMRVLESAPHRYDLGMRLITLGRIDRAYDALVAGVQPNQRVLDIGCGTGALTCRVARRGARVRGIDINPEMLAIARRRLHEAGVAADLAEAGVAELDAEPDAAYDVVVSGLCLSELSEQELDYTLAHVARILAAGGRLLVADEVRPENPALRVLATTLRLPLAALTYLITQQTTRAVRDLPQRLARAGLRLISQSRSGLGTFGVFVATKDGAMAP